MNTIQEIYEAVARLSKYVSETAKLERSKVEINIKSNGTNVLLVWERKDIPFSSYHKPEEGLDILFEEAWSWAYNLPSPERRELNRWIEKISATMEELGEGESEIVRELYGKLFDLRELATSHLLEHKEEVIS